MPYGITAFYVVYVVIQMPEADWMAIIAIYKFTAIAANSQGEVSNILLPRRLCAGVFLGVYIS